MDPAPPHLDVKLDLEKMSYPPCWNPVENRVDDDHQDDWFRTPGRAYCAYVASTIANPETGMWRERPLPNLKQTIRGAFFS